MLTLLREVGISLERYNNNKPTKKHRAVIWENILGTVYARNEDGEIKYFDSDWEGAAEFANLENAEDIRIAKFKRSYQGDGMRKGRTAIFVK